MMRKPAALDLGDDGDPSVATAPLEGPPAADLAGLKPQAPGPRPDAGLVRRASEAAGFTRDTPNPKPKPKEPERQLNFGMAPISIHDMIDDAAHKARMTRKAFLYSVLREHGLPIPDDLLRDRRKPSD